MASQRNPKLENDGKDSEAIFEKSMRKKGFVVFRLRDKRDLFGLNKRSVAAFGQPSDFVVIMESGAFLCEVKSSNNKTSFPLSCFTTAQRAAMAMCYAAKMGHNYRVYIHNMVTDEWYWTTANTIVGLIKDDVKSIKWQHLIPISF